MGRNSKVWRFQQAYWDAELGMIECVKCFALEGKPSAIRKRKIAIQSEIGIKQSDRSKCVAANLGFIELSVERVCPLRKRFRDGDLQSAITSARMSIQPDSANRPICKTAIPIDIDRGIDCARRPALSDQDS